MAAVIAVFLVAQLADCLAIIFWRYAGPGKGQLDTVTTQVYAPLEFYLLFLVGSGWHAGKRGHSRRLAALFVSPASSARAACGH
jgi:hypothetical protein